MKRKCLYVLFVLTVGILLTTILSCCASEEESCIVLASSRGHDYTIKESEFNDLVKDTDKAVWLMARMSIPYDNTNYTPTPFSIAIYNGETSVLWITIRSDSPDLTILDDNLLLQPKTHRLVRFSFQPSKYVLEEIEFTIHFDAYRDGVFAYSKKFSSTGG